MTIGNTASGSVNRSWSGSTVSEDPLRSNVGVLVAAHRWLADGLSGGQVQASQPGHAVAHQHLVHRGGVHTQPAGDRGRAQAPASPQMQDLAFDLRKGASRAAVRATGPVDHAGRAQLPVPIRPPLGGVHADLEPFRGTAQRPLVIDNALGQLQTATFGQGCVSVGHEDLRCEYGTCGSSTTHPEVFTIQDHSIVSRHQPLWVGHLGQRLTGRQNPAR
jgi:hypothetical protein